MADKRLLETSRHVEDEPQNFIEDGVTVNDTLVGFDPIPKEPISRACSPNKVGDSGYFDGAAESSEFKCVNMPDSDCVDLNRTIKSGDSSLVDAGLIDEVEAVLDERELEEKAEIVEKLQMRLSTLTTGGALCTTQLSDEVASKQKVHDQLSHQLHEKKSLERQEKVALLQFRREREEMIFQLNEHLLNEKQKVNDQISILNQHTEKVKKHLDNINSAYNDLFEKFEEMKAELMNFSAELDLLNAENQRRREAVSKHDIILRKNKLSTLERLADIADEIEKKNALIGELKQKNNDAGNP